MMAVSIAIKKRAPEVTPLELSRIRREAVECYSDDRPNLVLTGSRVFLKRETPELLNGTNTASDITYQFEWLASTRRLIPESLPRVFALVTVNNRIGYLMEQVQGKDLHYHLLYGMREAPAKREEIARQLTVTVGTLQRHGIGHGDLTPWNILLEESGRVKLIDPMAVGSARSGTATYADLQDLDEICGLLRSDNCAREYRRFLERYRDRNANVDN